MPERLPEFDNSRNISKPPRVNRSKFKKEAYSGRYTEFKTQCMGLQVPYGMDTKV
jgi:hypothetical protein